MPRRPHDFYETPPHYIDALFKHVTIKGEVLEPCVGDGCLGKRLFGLSSVRMVWTNDIDPNREADYWEDAALIDAVFWDARKYDWVVTNPPFKQELPILLNALDYCDNVAFLARLSFLEPTYARYDMLWAMRQPTQIIVLPRYSFRENDKGQKSSDNVTCCWLLFTTGATTRGISFSGDRG